MGCSLPCWYWWLAIVGCCWLSPFLFKASSSRYVVSRALSPLLFEGELRNQYVASGHIPAGGGSGLSGGMQFDLLLYTCVGSCSITVQWGTRSDTGLTVSVVSSTCPSDRVKERYAGHVQFMIFTVGLFGIAAIASTTTTIASGFV